MYTPIKLNVFTDQHDKLKNAVTHQKAASLKLNLEGGDPSQQEAGASKRQTSGWFSRDACWIGCKSVPSSTQRASGVASTAVKKVV